MKKPQQKIKLALWPLSGHVAPSLDCGQTSNMVNPQVNTIQ
jgi:hypothetical protein